MAKAKAESVVDAVDAVDMVDPLGTEKALKAEIATKMGNRVSAPIAKLTAIRQMHAGNTTIPSREKTAEDAMRYRSTSPAMDQSRPEPSSQVQIQSKRFFNWDRIDPRC